MISFPIAIIGQNRQKTTVFDKFFYPHIFRISRPYARESLIQGPRREFRPDLRCDSPYFNKRAYTVDWHRITEPARAAEVPQQKDRPKLTLIGRRNIPWHLKTGLHHQPCHR